MTCCLLFVFSKKKINGADDRSITPLRNNNNKKKQVVGAMTGLEDPCAWAIFLNTQAHTCALFFSYWFIKKMIKQIIESN
jgi:hypothetical protein